MLAAEERSDPGYTKVCSSKQDVHFCRLPVGFPGKGVTPTRGEVEALCHLAVGEMLFGTPGHVEAAAGEQRLNTASSLFQPAQIDLP